MQCPQISDEKNTSFADENFFLPEFHRFANIVRNKGRMLEFSLGSHLGWYLRSILDHFQSSTSKISKIHVFGH